MLATEALSESRLADLVLNLSALYAELPENWVFAGVLLRADYEYNPNVIGGGAWVAVATKTKNDTYGPIPEVRGHGYDIVNAIVDLRAELMEIRNAE